jgi:hypothetical protein
LTALLQSCPQKINVLQRTNNFHQQHSHKTEKFENNLQFWNNFLANLRKPAQFSKHSVSFMQFSEPHVIVTQLSESAQCRLDLHLFQAGKFHGTYAFMRYQGNAMERPFSISALGSVYGVAQKNLWCCEPKPACCTLSNMKLPAAETDYWSGISWSRKISWINPLREVRKKLHFYSNNANNWGNIICKQKNKRKKCSKQLTKYSFN